VLCVLLQLYRVNVLLQSADSPDLSSKPPFFVLRRYSQFRQLHNEVRHQQQQRSSSTAAAAAAAQAAGMQWSMVVPPMSALATA
jgi:hypothetical protein